jgi:hypothetical protein
MPGAETVKSVCDNAIHMPEIGEEARTIGG